MLYLLCQNENGQHYNALRTNLVVQFDKKKKKKNV